jgi:hypothetical protein
MHPETFNSRSAWPQPISVLTLANRLNDAMRESMLGMLTPLIRLFESGQAGHTTSLDRLRPRHGEGCGCRECCDPCEPKTCDPCKCCVGDVDVVVYARPGETRSIPFVVANDRVRQRKVTVSIGKWQTSDGKDVGVVSHVTPGELVMEPCTEAVLSVRVTIPQSKEQSDAPGRRSRGRCEVLYANLSFEGCRTRPLALALAILADDCWPHQVHCSSCCC